MKTAMRFRCVAAFFMMTVPMQAQDQHPITVAMKAAAPVKAAATVKAALPVKEAVPATQAEQDQITNSLGMKLVLIPAGEFQMGADEDAADTLNAFPYAPRDWLNGESPRHRVRITKPFYMGA